MEIVAFGRADIGNIVARMDKAQLDGLPFGAVLLDKRGTVMKYNRMEQEIASRNDPKKVLGKNWFRDVAPCTRSREFYGKFIEGVARNALDVVFDYVFDYKMNPQRVRIHMKNANVDGYYWVFVKRIVAKPS